MAESKSPSGLETSKAAKPSNEELINSLMSDLEKCEVQEGTSQRDNNINTTNKITSDSRSEVGDNNSALRNDNEKTLPKVDNDDADSACESADEDKTIPSHEDDLVDELAMKDLELTYTDEDKERLRKEAEAFKQNGNDLFKSGQYRDSALAYTQALRTCPLIYAKDRAIFYSNRAAAKMKLELNEAAIEDCTKAVELDERYLKALFRRAQLLEATDKLDEALADYNKILQIDPLHKEALYASKRLPEQIQERNEKLKTEMLGKLKDLGNMFLKPFGLSTDNFQMAQDPNSGGYSVNFKS